jgi:hypothetical protein
MIAYSPASTTTFRASYGPAVKVTRTFWTSAIGRLRNLSTYITYPVTIPSTHRPFKSSSPHPPATPPP